MMTDMENGAANVEYDDQTGTYHGSVEWSAREGVSSSVVTAVAQVAGIDPTELEPLYDRVDPEALDSLFAPRKQVPRDEGSVSFSLQGHHVTVYADGDMVIEPPAT